MRKLKKYQFRANVQGRIDAVSVELVLVSPEDAAREEALKKIAEDARVRNEGPVQ